MKKLFLFLVALVIAACQTTPPKDCGTLMREVAAAHQAQGRMVVDGAEDPAGATLGVFWDFKSPKAQVELLAAEDYKLPEGFDMQEVGACQTPGKGPDADPRLWKHYQKEVPVNAP